MSDKPKPRKQNNSLFDLSKKIKGKKNLALNRYKREFILEKYAKLSTPFNYIPEDILLLYLPEPQNTCLEIRGFFHDLGDQINSRSYPRERKVNASTDLLETLEEQINEVYEYNEPPDFDDNDSIEENDRIVLNTDKIVLKSDAPEFISSFTPSALQPEEKKVNKFSFKLPINDIIEKKQFSPNLNDQVIKKVNKKDLYQSKSNRGYKSDRNYQEHISIIPAYEKTLLTLFSNKGNPFARTMIQTGIEGEDGRIYFPLSTRPYEKVWSYKDLEDNVQGPFSSIEMFNWTVRRCFPDNLEISFCNTEFIPMNNYFTRLQITFSEKNLPKPAPELKKTEITHKSEKSLKKSLKPSIKLRKKFN